MPRRKLQPLDPHKQLKQLLVAEPDLAERLLRVASPLPAEEINSAATAAALLRQMIFGRPEEHLAIVGLSRRNTIVGKEVLTKGNDAFTIVCPRQIYRWALTRKRAVNAIIIGHNHPSGNLTPSIEDWEVTRKISAAGALIGITLLDHIIVGDTDVYSLAQHQPDLFSARRSPASWAS